MKSRLFASLLLVCLLLSACSTGQVFKKDDNGKTVEVKAGETFSIEIEGNPTTGYVWEARPDTSGLLSLTGEPDYISDSNLIGSGGTYTFTFRAEKTGQTTLELAYYRSFEKDVPPIETFTSNVSVK